MKILNVVGARPNLVKIGPIIREMRRQGTVEPVLIHTGQHYDPVLSDRFFEDLDIPRPHRNLGVGSGSHAAQTAAVMKHLEPVLEEVGPDVVLVVGDVNSTLAAALTAVKMGLPVVHVEAGLRSFDRTMPEEINRHLTDAVSDLLFVTEESGRQNLLREGVAAERIHLVGNVMIDALLMSRARWERSTIQHQLGLSALPYAVVTMHRPATVDDPGRLLPLLHALAELVRYVRIVFPVHPRVRGRLQATAGPWRWIDAAAQPCPADRIALIDPLSYLDFVALLSRARLALTDSGGIQEETTFLGVPCLTLRANTERPVTVTHGTNRVIGTDPARVVAEAQWTLEAAPIAHPTPPLWDGQAAPRIVRILRDVYGPAPRPSGGAAGTPP
jgi:UDP-N-acetylglucosamine 2-epimerase (non-hydrolysing)